MNTQIVSTPGCLGGKPRIDGTRISVELILEMFSLGYTMGDILEAYPHITQEQVFAALAYAYNQISQTHAHGCIAS